MSETVFKFNRYVDGILMAEGARVRANSEAEAAVKAHRLFGRDAHPGEMDRTVFVRCTDGQSKGGIDG